MKTTIHFCQSKKGCCPVIENKGNDILLGGKDEGVTKWSKGQFKDFLNAAKAGKFDAILK